MTSGEKKFIIRLALVLLTWRVAQLPAVQHAFLQFLAVGEIPGLDQPLSPKATYILLACIFSVSLVLIFRTELSRSIRRHRHQPDHRLKGQPIEMQTHALQQLSITIRRTPVAGMQIPIAKLNLGDKKLPALYVPPIMPSVWRLMDLEMRLMTTAFVRIRTAARFTWKHIVIIARAVWKWLEPRIRRLDKQIEKRVQRSQVVSEILEIIEACWQTVRLRTRQTGQKYSKNNQA